MEKDTIESLVKSSPLLLLFYWVYSSGLWGTEAGPWFLAVVVILGVECIDIWKQWTKPAPVPHDDPIYWFDRFTDVLQNFWTVLYVAGATVWVNNSYFAWLKHSLASWDFSRSAVWGPLAMWAFLLACSAYAVPMGWRYSRVPRSPGRLINSVLVVGGGAFLIGFGVFVPASNSVLGPNATAALNFFILWLYTAAIFCFAVRFALVLRGVGGTARERAQQQVAQESGAAQWPTGNE